MRVIVNLRHFVPGVMGGGMETYVRQAVPALHDHLEIVDRHVAITHRNVEVVRRGAPHERVGAGGEQEVAREAPGIHAHDVFRVVQGQREPVG